MAADAACGRYRGIGLKPLKKDNEFVRTLSQVLKESSAFHRRLCPRQVLGARMGLLAGEDLDISLPQAERRLLAIVETDGCVVDGIAAATHCHLGRRTLRIEDYGKVAATFVDMKTEQAVRIVPRREARLWAAAYAPQARNKWEAMLLGYQNMPAARLLAVHPVCIRQPLAALISQAGRRRLCENCGEEIINGREVVRGETIWCRPCSSGAYYVNATASLPEAIGLNPERPVTPGRPGRQEVPSSLLPGELR